MALPVEDTFTEATDTTLDNHTSDSGHSWGSGSDGAANYDVLSATGTIESTSGSPDCATCQASPSSADYTTEVTGQVVSSSNGRYFGIIARWDGGSVGGGTGYVLRLNEDADFQLYEVTTGTFSLLEQVSISGFSVSTTYKLTLDISGSTLTASVDDTEEISQTDSTTSSAGNPGVITRRTEPSMTLFEAFSASGADETASGTPSIDELTADGAATVIQTASGGPSLTELTADGNTQLGLPASGTPTLTELTADGAAAIGGAESASGTPSLSELTADGAATVIQTVSGSAILAELTADGNVQLGLPASGTPTLSELTADGTVSVNGVAVVSVRFIRIPLNLALGL